MRRGLAVLLLGLILQPGIPAQAQRYLGEWAAHELGRLGPSGLALDTSDGVTHLYVADDRFGRIFKYNAGTGARVAVWGEAGSEPGQFNRPFGLAVDPKTRDLYVVERGNRRVQRITSSGTHVTMWGVLGTGAGQFDSPIGVAVDAAGDVYVTDYGNDRVQKFRVHSPTQVEHLATWGGTGSAPGRFDGPFGITLGPGGNLWVADTRNHRLQKFSPTGQLLGVVGTPGTGDGQFVTPSWVGFDPTGAYYVAETNSNPQDFAAADIHVQRIQKFGADGAFRLRWGTFGEGPGQFRFPIAAAVDATNHAYVADYYNSRVQTFDLGASPAPPPGPGTGGAPPGAPGAARFVNLSARLRTASHDPSRALIAGFVVAGTAPKPMLIRAVGPTLAGFGVSGAVENPGLRIYSGDRLVAQNDDWTDAPDLRAASSRVGAFELPGGSRDAALLVTLPPGAYSAQVETNGGEGVALVEVYDAEPGQTTAQLINLSTRGLVGTGDAVLVAGFAVSGTGPKRVLVRGVGAALAAFGVEGVLADAVLRLHRGTTMVAQNDNWEAAQPVAGGPAPAGAGEVAEAARSAGAFALPAGSRDAALLLTLEPGTYSAILSGAGESTGAGLIEVYEVR